VARLKSLPKILDLQCGHTTLQVCPEAGGSIARFFSHTDDSTIEWMRPAAIEDINNSNALGMSCFPLLPYSGRIRDGAFRFDDADINLPLNFLPERHSIHGHGWQNVWSPVEQSVNRLVIEYSHVADEWIWGYLARQTFELSEDLLSVKIELKNDSDRLMPAGVGLHPYFPQTPQSFIRASTTHVWLTDDEVMPVALSQADLCGELDAGLYPHRTTIDNVFTGWRGETVIEWPERDTRLSISASDDLSHLVVFSPADETHFCVEPVSHCPDAVNLVAMGRRDTGMVILQAGESVSSSMYFGIAENIRAG
jgi:aldose 1-epimerase